MYDVYFIKDPGYSFKNSNPFSFYQEIGIVYYGNSLLEPEQCKLNFNNAMWNGYLNIKAITKLQLSLAIAFWRSRKYIMCIII